jgi:azurin
MKLLFTCVLAATLAAGMSLRAEQLTGTTTSSTTTADKSKARTIELIGTEKMKFDKEEIVAKPGETLRIVLRAVGSMPKAVMAHNFVLLKAGVDAAEFNKASFSARDTDFIAPDRKDDVIAATGLAGAGETVEVVFKAPAKPGSFTFLCSFPGHFAMGMRGKLIVK